MSFIYFLFRETKPSKIVLATAVGTILFMFLPHEYEKQTPTGWQLIYYILIFIVLCAAGFFLSAIEKKEGSSIRVSPVFDQASSAVISLTILLIPIYLLRSKLFGLALLFFVVEFGLVFGRFIYIRKRARLRNGR
jgi:hypothetical protein